MFCSNCGAQMSDDAVFCTKCGVAASGGAPASASTTPPTPQAAPPPGWTTPAPGPAPGPAPTPTPGAPAPRQKLVAALLGIFLGAFGVHRFYLGYTNIGIAQLVLGVLGFFTCGITTIASGIWGLVEGIMILTGSINRDAQGQPLVE